MLYETSEVKCSVIRCVPDQGKEIEENNKMGNTRDLFKKIRDIKGRFHEKMGTIKDRNDMDGSSWHCTGGSDQDHPQEKDMQKCKMATWGGLPNSCEKKTNEKQRRKRDITIWMQTSSITRRDKKAFFSDQCKEIEENNRMGNTRDLFKKIRDTKGTFHAKLGTIKDRNDMDLTEA